ncbi:MAG: hypothetical protein HYU28_10975, partial [Actinobacteria bacterium]|nr:hypothetical protein [Actinomycetota bacterium]
TFLAVGTVGDTLGAGGGSPAAGYIQVEDQIAAATCAHPGDSGGPIYWPSGGTGAAVAHGMISSILGCAPGGTERITFTPLAAVEAALGVQVRTQS